MTTDLAKAKALLNQAIEPSGVTPDVAMALAVAGIGHALLDIRNVLRDIANELGEARRHV